MNRALAGGAPFARRVSHGGIRYWAPIRPAASDIGALQTDVSANEVDITANAANIATNTADLATLDTTFAGVTRGGPPTRSPSPG
jgi:hypothetical protein